MIKISKLFGNKKEINHEKRMARRIFWKTKWVNKSNSTTRTRDFLDTISVYEEIGTVLDMFDDSK